jgi:hypothetical protein
VVTFGKGAMLRGPYEEEIFSSMDHSALSNNQASLVIEKKILVRYFLKMDT